MNSVGDVRGNRGHELHEDIYKGEKISRTGVGKIQPPQERSQTQPTRADLGIGGLRKGRCMALAIWSPRKVAARRISPRQSRSSRAEGVGEEVILILLLL